MSVGRIWQTEKLKIWQKKNNLKHLERDTFCALSERSHIGGLPDPWELLFSVNRLQKRLQVKALRLWRAIQSHSETALITDFTCPNIQQVSPIHGSNSYLNKNRKSMSGKEGSLLITGQIIQMDVNEKYPSIVWTTINNVAHWTGPLPLWQLHIQLRWF